MTETLYVRAHEPGTAERVVNELLDREHVSPERLHAYGKRLPGGLRVEATRWRSTALAILPGAVVGAVAVPFLWLVVVETPSDVATLALGLIGAVAAGGWSLMHERRKDSPMNAQKRAMRHGDLLIAADVDDSEADAVERRIADSHPEVDVLGSDPAQRP
ncbi:MAG: hypothetical protein GVY09_16705 [Gammaproteobacteria bacterium]|jgi:hypothetical protein|nr:hypothetical protein [Gammaproteobacteria bacterium]